MVLITFLINAALVDLGIGADQPDLPGEIQQRHWHRPGGFHCRDCRRVQSGARRDRRRTAARRRRQSSPPPSVPTQYRGAVPMLLLIAVHLVPPAGPARPARGAQGMTGPTRVLAGALGLVLGAGLLAFWLQPYGIYLLSLWAVYDDRRDRPQPDARAMPGRCRWRRAPFVGIGAYTTALLMPHGAAVRRYSADRRRALFRSWRGCLAIPALRVQHHYLAFVTLAFTTLVFLVLRNEEWLTGGIYGINHIRRPSSAFTASRRLSIGSASVSPRAGDVRRRGGCSARPGAAPSSRCAKTRCARRRSASTSGATR